MPRIKSALEIALERTESVQSDKAGIGQFEAKQRGKKIANEFLSDPQISLREAIKKTPKEEQASLKQGIFDVLVAQITVPASRDDMKRLETIGNGLQTVIADAGFTTLYGQLTQALSSYLDEADHYAEAIQRQYEPKLRQKEEELSRRLGREIRLDPFQDAEFVSFYNQNMNALKANYEAAVTQTREQALAIFHA
jgi:predicted flap endonuclease-1-like 5' DNA nuclease